MACQGKRIREFEQSLCVECQCFISNLLDGKGARWRNNWVFREHMQSKYFVKLNEVETALDSVRVLRIMCAECKISTVSGR